MKQSQPLRVEYSDIASLITTRFVNSSLWFVNNKPLEKRILGYLAKYTHKYEAVLYAFVFFGSHYHLVAQFPKCNRALFMRDFNARIAEAVKALVPEYPGGPVFERRYSEQALPLSCDIEDKVSYCALQAVAAGLCKSIDEYPGYNSFNDASAEVEREYEVISWSQYRSAKRANPNVPIKNYTEAFKLKFSRIPELDELTEEQYQDYLRSRVELDREELVKEHYAEGRVAFKSRRELMQVQASSKASKPKKSGRHDARPLVLTKCMEAKREFLEWYFSIYERYKQAVEEYFQGDFSTDFPIGTYRPPGVLIASLVVESWSQLRSR